MKFLTTLSLSSTSSKRRRRQRQFEEVAAAAYVQQSKVEPTAATSNSGSNRNDRNNSSSSNNSSSNNSNNRRNIAPLPKYPFLKENPQYLLKMCQHGDWKHIQRCCDIMKEIILQQNSNNNSNRNHKEERRHHDDDDDHLLVLIPCCRQQFLQRTAESDGHQNTPLHVLCKRDHVPVEVLTSFLGAIDSLQWWDDNKDHQHHQHQHQYQHPLWIENADGETPLLVACRTGARMAVIRALVQTPEGAQAITLPDEQRMTPIAALVHRFEMNSEFSLRPSTTTNNTMASPKRLSSSSSSFADNDTGTVSTTSTSITTSSSSSISSSTMLYNESDHQHHHYDEDDEDYPSLVSVSSSSSSSSEVSSRVVVADDDDDKTTTSTTSNRPILLIEDLIRVAWEHSAPRSLMELLDDDDYHYYTPLHGAAWIADCLPTHLLEEFIQTYGGEQSSRSSSSSSHHHHHFKHDDDDPFCPLHVALLARRIPQVDQKRRSQSSSLPPPLPGSNTNPTMTLQRTHAIRRLVAANPVAVQCPVVVVTRGRRRERSVLATAIASGLSWHQQVGRAEEEGSTVIIVGPLQTLFHAHPTALLERDSDSQLLPFQLAAAVAAATVTTTNMKMGMVRILDDEATTLQVDTIYNLLRQAPQQLIFAA